MREYPKCSAPGIERCSGGADDSHRAAVGNSLAEVVPVAKPLVAYGKAVQAARERR
jgi:hypothetical protein